jgi:hypothetical protein
VSVAKPVKGVVTVEPANLIWNAAGNMLQVVVDLDEAGAGKPVSDDRDAIGKLLSLWFAEGSAAGNMGDLYDNHDRGHSSLNLTQFPQFTRIQYGAALKARQLDNGLQNHFFYTDAHLTLNQAPAATAEADKSTDKAADKDSTGAAANDGTTDADRQAGKESAPQSLTEQADQEDKDASIDVKHDLASGPTTDTPGAPGTIGNTGTLTVQRAVVLGNASTALTGSIFWRSMPRLGLTTDGGGGMFFHQYINNHLYVYPEHKDHDPGHSGKAGWGDVFFANTPYYVISQGSSGSDQPFLQAFAATLAAFPKDVKNQLRASGMLAPTLQMIFRRCNRRVLLDQDYLSGNAHPTAFDAARLNVDGMVRMAHSLKLEDVPPLVVLQLQSEDVGDPRKDYFDAKPCEGLLTTPCAMARACFSTDYWREMQVSASTTGTSGTTTPELHWVVLRGDPKRIEIQPVAGQPNARRLRIGYHPRQRIRADLPLESNRVDIGVFAYNGKHYSAPSILSFYFPDNEVREYDAQQRIVSVDYREATANYADPAVVPTRDWRDEYHYGADGKLTGWTRIRGSGREEFNAAGELVASGDQPKQAGPPRQVRYERVANADGSQQIKQVLAEPDKKG